MKIEIYVKGYKEEKENAFHFAFLHKKRRNTEKNYRFQDMEIPRFFIHFRRLSSSTLVTNTAC